MKRIEREKVIRNAYRSTILALTICCIFLGAVLVIHELAREYEVRLTHHSGYCECKDSVFFLIGKWFYGFLKKENCTLP